VEIAMRILIVEGNSEELIARNEQSGRPQAWQTWETALRLHRPDADVDVTFPYAAERDGRHGRADEYDGFVITGSGVFWSAADERAKPFLARIEPLLGTGRPVIGACWGLQTASVALGGSVGANPKGSEVGLARIELTEAGATHSLFSGSPRRFASPTWHRDHVTEMPAGAVLLASSPVSEVQAIAYRKAGVDFFGFQYHPEAELEDFRKGFEAYGAQPDSVAVIADFPDDPPEEVRDPVLRTHTIGNWLRHVAEKAKA
jgi:GMP synthase (glutamine-hydrolysing)